MSGWNPSQYLKYAGPRLRPAIDLIERIGAAFGAAPAPRAIFDLGCGTGNTTRLLAERWPAADLVGVDGSADMLARARESDIGARWMEAELADWAPPAPPDLLYSNAALHWLDGHEVLFPHLMGCLSEGGVLAVQMPRNHGEPSHTLMADAARAGPWWQRLKRVRGLPPVAPPETYYDILAPVARRLEIWESVYLHVLEGDDPVVEWTRATGFRPLLDALDGAEREGLLEDYRARIAKAYPKRADGKTLFPFRRMFIVAVR
jgi:trans-aconitate 2-methyltransferase